ncbi:exocyst complex component Sec5-domain-containing protein [Scenedesmus sp. NREL 46B-D3]|nr:exocyst complex component Sec5-domain-containing protein [Scenedesmus sp. NREL 46B-D3]
MEEDSDDISFVEEPEEEDVVTQLRRTSRPSNDTDVSSEGIDPLLSGISMSGANSWQDVDREQLSSTVLKLISSVASTAPVDDKSRDAVWHPTTTFTVSQDQYQDPLGFGTINLLNMKLERPGADEQQQQQQPIMMPSGQGMAAAVSGKQGKQGNQGSAVRAVLLLHQPVTSQHPRPAQSLSDVCASLQGKGAVGRFFSELTRQGPVPELRRKTELTRQPSSSAGPAAAGTGGSAARHSSSRAKPASEEAHPAASFVGGLKQAKLLLCEEGFEPGAYLAVFHEGSSAGELAAGLRALDRELGERTGQLKQLVKQNFDRFISCKTTIDDIYVKLQHIESTSTGISTEVLYSAIQQVQDGASTVFGPILERSAKAERIRSVQLLLRRFQGLFSAPQRITAHAAARDFEQVTAEFKKANGLIKPGPRTIKVWAALHAEIEKRASEVYQQLQAEVQDPGLPTAPASELALHMLQLQAEGLPAAQGQDPLVLLLAAREARFAAAMQAVAAEHDRSVGRLRGAMAAAADDERLQDPAAISEAQLLRWRGTWDGSSSSSATRPGLPPAAAAGSGSAAFARSIAGHLGSTAAAAAVGSNLLSSLAGAGHVSELGSGLRSLSSGFLGGGLPGSRHLAEVAPLSGLQPPAPRSRLVQDTMCTAGELLYLNNLQRHSEVLLECLPGLWQAAGTSKLQLPPHLPAAAAAKLQQTLAGADGILQRLVSGYCREIGSLLAALSAVGPLREAQLAAAEVNWGCVWGCV